MVGVFRNFQKLHMKDVHRQVGFYAKCKGPDISLSLRGEGEWSLESQPDLSSASQIQQILMASLSCLFRLKRRAQALCVPLTSDIKQNYPKSTDIDGIYLLLWFFFNTLPCAKSCSFSKTRPTITRSPCWEKVLFFYLIPHSNFGGYNVFFFFLLVAKGSCAEEQFTSNNCSHFSFQVPFSMHCTHPIWLVFLIISQYFL